MPSRDNAPRRRGVIETPLRNDTDGMTDLQADAFRFLRSEGLASRITEIVGVGGRVHSVAEAGDWILIERVENSPALYSAIQALRTGPYLTVGRQGVYILFYRVTGQAASDFAVWLSRRGYRSPDPHAKPLPPGQPVKRYPVVVLSQDDNSTEGALTI